MITLVHFKYKDFPCIEGLWGFRRQPPCPQTPNTPRLGMVYYSSRAYYQNFPNKVTCWGPLDQQKKTQKTRKMIIVPFPHRYPSHQDDLEASSMPC